MTKISNDIKTLPFEIKDGKISKHKKGGLLMKPEGLHAEFKDVLNKKAPNNQILNPGNKTTLKTKTVVEPPVGVKSVFKDGNLKSIDDRNEFTQKTLPTIGEQLKNSMTPTLSKETPDVVTKEKFANQKVDPKKAVLETVIVKPVISDYNKKMRLEEDYNNALAAHRNEKSTIPPQKKSNKPLFDMDSVTPQLTSYVGMGIPVDIKAKSTHVGVNAKSINGVNAISGSSKHMDHNSAQTIERTKELEALKLISKEFRNLDKEMSTRKFDSVQDILGVNQRKHQTETKIHMKLNPKEIGSTAHKTTNTDIQKVIQINEKANLAELPKDAQFFEMRADNMQKSLNIKGASFAEVREILTREVERYVEMKIVNPNRVILTLGDLESGRMEIQIEKKDKTIFISVKVDDKASQEKMEATMEQLKNELKEKQIDIEYEVEKEQKEKRKEQEGQAMKEDMREEDDESHKKNENFEKFMEGAQL